MLWCAGGSRPGVRPPPEKRQAGPARTERRTESAERGQEGNTVPRPAPDKRRERESEEDLVRLYLDDIGKHELLTKDDEVRLSRQIEAGTAARAQLQRPGRLGIARRR